MLAAQYATVSDVEILWVFIAICGVAVSAWNYKQARMDEIALDVLNVAPNGKLKIAKTAKTQDAIRIAIHSIFMFIGFAAMMIKDPADVTPRPWNMILISIAITYGLIVGSGLLVIGSFLAANVRRDLLFEERQRQHLLDAMTEKTEEVMTGLEESEGRLSDQIQQGQEASTIHTQKGQDESQARDEESMALDEEDRKNGD